MCVNDCQSCQHSFSKTQNCPENTASKRCVQGLHAGQTDGAGPGPPHHATCLCIFPGGTSPRPVLCTLPSAPHSHCAQSPCSVLHGESRGHCKLGTMPFPYCKRFTWSGPPSEAVGAQMSLELFRNWMRTLYTNVYWTRVCTSIILCCLSMSSTLGMSSTWIERNSGEGNALLERSVGNVAQPPLRKASGERGWWAGPTSMDKFSSGKSGLHCTHAAMRLALAKKLPHPELRKQVFTEYFYLYRIWARPSRYGT